MPAWTDASRHLRELAALRLVAPLVALNTEDLAAVEQLLAAEPTLPAAEGDAFAAFARTFPAPHARLARAKAEHDDALVAEIEDFLANRWRSRHLEEAAAGPASAADLVAVTCGVVQAMAIPLTGLPDFLGDHLGTSEPITGDLVAQTVGAATWTVDQTRGLVLTAECTHPAMHVAIEESVAKVSQLLPGLAMASSAGAAGTAATTPLRATANVHAAVRDGVAAYIEPGVRFLLAEDRIRSLLMGENLYRRSGLALRELYQNAVDACRHREARLGFLARDAGTVPDVDVPATVTFTQHKDAAGRVLIECTDTGVGMGITEIRGAFCQAGIRSADLPEYLEEIDDFNRLDPPVRLWTNSRFGIGALSYFMLADEITILTTRTHRDGSLGHMYRIQIASAGTYFRIEDLGAGSAPGTTVRLTLRDDADVSCVEELRSVVVVAPYALHVADHVHDLHNSWDAGVLDTSSTALSDLARAANVPAPGADGATRVWFTAGDGGILADGLWAGKTKDHVVVNLEAEHAPQLSVDRTEIISFDTDAVTAHLLDAVPAMAAGGELLLQMPDWLLELAHTEPVVADELYRARAARGPWPYLVDNAVVDASVTGIADADATIVDCAGEPESGVMSAWRLSALIAAGALQNLEFDAQQWSVAPALPSDSVSLSRDGDGTRQYITAAPTRSRVAFTAARMRCTVPDVVTRLRELGFAVLDQDPIDDADRKILNGLSDQIKKQTKEPATVDILDLVALAPTVRLTPAQVVSRCAAMGIHAEPALDGDPMTATDLVVASVKLDGKPAWLTRGEPVPLHHILGAANAARRPVRDICQRLASLGFQVPQLPDGIEAQPIDTIIMSRDGDSKAPWLTMDETVSIGSVLRVSRKATLEPAAVAERLRVLNFRIAPDGPAALSEPNAQILLSRDLDGMQPWLEAGAALDRSFITRAARESQQDVARVRAFYEEMGFRVIWEVGAGNSDAIITSRDLDALPPFLTTQEPISVGHICQAAQRTGMTIQQVLDRFEDLGYQVDLPARSSGVPRADANGDSPGCFGFDPPVNLPSLVGSVQPANVLVPKRKKFDKVSTADLIRQIRDVGFPVVGNLRGSPDTIDHRLLSLDLDAALPIRDIRISVGRVTLLCVSRKLKLAPAETAERLRRWGYAVDIGDAPLPAKVTKKLYQILGGRATVDARMDAQLPAGVVLKGAVNARVSIAEACERLRVAGVTFVDPRNVLPTPRPGDTDVTLMLGKAGESGSGNNCACGCC